MKRIFLDSSVLFSGAYSPRGHSRDLLMMAIRGEINLVISDLVIEETRRNLAEHAPQAKDFLDLVLDLIPFEAVNPTRQEIVAAMEFVVLKDAAIIAAARKAGVDLLVSMDQKHILDKPELADYAGMPIVTPQEAMAYIKGSN
ncbi:putative toxin-antitoxin system toxin component, PIN family [Chloroflexota bacterium]